MAQKYNLVGKQIGKLTVKSLVPINERPTQTHGNYWLCQCTCGNTVKIPTSYLTGNGNYTQTSCGCDRKKKAFQATTYVNVDGEFLEKYSNDFEKYLIIHKALIRTSGNDLQYYNEHISDYKEIIEYFWDNRQFNAIYSFWQSQKNNYPTFYDWAKPSLDHITPKSRGGDNSLSNLQFLTTFENLAKRDMTQEEWDLFKKETHTTSNYFIENILK